MLTQAPNPVEEMKLAALLLIGGLCFSFAVRISPLGDDDVAAATQLEAFVQAAQHVYWQWQQNGQLSVDPVTPVDPITQACSFSIISTVQFSARQVSPNSAWQEQINGRSALLARLPLLRVVHLSWEKSALRKNVLKK